jgi:predicted MFS family arabinose efflux permease
MRRLPARRLVLIDSGLRAALLGAIPLAYGPYSALSFTVLQDRAPAASLTTVLAARSAVLLTASPLGALSGGLLVDRTSAPAVLSGCGGLMILIAVVSAVLVKTLKLSNRRVRFGHETVPLQRGRS